MLWWVHKCEDSNPILIEYFLDIALTIPNKTWNSSKRDHGRTEYPFKSVTFTRDENRMKGFINLDKMNYKMKHCYRNAIETYCYIDCNANVEIEKRNNSKKKILHIFFLCAFNTFSLVMLCIEFFFVLCWTTL